jgi:catabolite regulation protein CreA
MANIIDYATIFQQALDTQMVQGATSGWMEANAGQVIYNGGKEIKIPKISMDGLGNYDRVNGFTQGSINLSYETMIMTQDRARTFQLDAMDVNESNFVANASAVMAEFQRVHVIPEVDAYRYSKIASLAIAAGRASGGYTPAVADILSKIKADIAAMQDVVGDVPLIITMSFATKNILENSTELTKQLSVVDFTQGQVNTKVVSIDGYPIITVPSVRLKTAYVFYDGKTAGQEAGGFVADASAKTINWIICAQTAPIAVSKTDNIRIFDPSVNQVADAYKIDYRKYHDLWIPDNKMSAVFVNIKEALV